MDMKPAAIGAISAAIAVPLFMQLMRKISAFKNTPASEKTLEELTKEYSRWVRFASLLLIVFSGLIGIMLWKIISVLFAIRMSYVEPSVYLISQPAVTWALPSLFLSIFISAIPLHFLYLALLGKDRYAEYTEYGNLKSGINSWKLLRYMAYVIAPLCLVFTLFSFDSYARVTDSAFIVNPFFGFGETRYDFDQIEYLALTKSFKAPNGNIVRRKSFKIGFKDGSSYDFRKTLHDLNDNQQSEIVNYISEKSNVKISVYDPYPY